MKFLSRDEILQLADRRTEEVDVPEWGCSVRVRELSAADRDELEAMMVKKVNSKIIPDTSNQRAKVVVLAVVDENGERLFSVQDVPAIAQKNGRAINRIYEAAVRLGLLQADAVEESAKN